MQLPPCIHRLSPHCCRVSLLPPSLPLPPITINHCRCCRVPQSQPLSTHRQRLLPMLQTTPPSAVNHCCHYQSPLITVPAAECCWYPPSLPITTTTAVTPYQPLISTTTAYYHCCCETTAAEYRHYTPHCHCCRRCSTVTAPTAAEYSCYSTHPIAANHCCYPHYRRLPPLLQSTTTTKHCCKSPPLAASEYCRYPPSTSITTAFHCYSPNATATRTLQPSATNRYRQRLLLTAIAAETMTYKRKNI